MSTKEKLHINNKLLVKERRQKFFEKGTDCYPGAKLINDKTYKEIKKEFDSGEKSAINKLFEESIGNIIFAVADNYAKLDLEDLLPFEEGLSYTIERLLQYMLKYDYLVPTYKSKYVETIIQYNVHNILTQKYDLMKAKKHGVEVVCKTPSDIAWIIDHIESEEISMQTLNIEAVRPKLETMISKLRDREQQALRLRFGFVTGQPESLETISKIMGITRSAVDRIVKMAIARMKKQKAFDKIQEYNNPDLSV